MGKITVITADFDENKIFRFSGHQPYKWLWLTTHCTFCIRSVLWNPSLERLSLAISGRFFFSCARFMAIHLAFVICNCIRICEAVIDFSHIAKSKWDPEENKKYGIWIHEHFFYRKKRKLLQKLTLTVIIYGKHYV